jgi:hypothetical protein
MSEFQVVNFGFGLVVGVVLGFGVWLERREGKRREKKYFAKK